MGEGGEGEMIMQKADKGIGSDNAHADNGALSGLAMDRAMKGLIRKDYPCPLAYTALSLNKMKQKRGDSQASLNSPTKKSK